MTKWQRTLRALAKEHGCTLSGGGERHFQLRHPSGWSVVASSSPSDHRALVSVRRDLVRKARGK